MIVVGLDVAVVVIAPPCMANEDLAPSMVTICPDPCLGDLPIDTGIMVIFGGVFNGVIGNFPRGTICFVGVAGVVSIFCGEPKDPAESVIVFDGDDTMMVLLTRFWVLIGTTCCCPVLVFLIITFVIGPDWLELGRLPTAWVICPPNEENCKSWLC